MSCQSSGSMIIFTLIIRLWSNSAVSYSIVIPVEEFAKTVSESRHSPKLTTKAAAISITARRSANLVPSKDIPPYDMYSPL